jgi:hypothetical protein
LNVAVTPPALAVSLAASAAGANTNAAVTTHAMLSLRPM